MPWAKATPVLLDYEPGELCKKRYPGHPRGCPNYGQRPTCPPRATQWDLQYLAQFDSYVVWTVYEFGEHVEKMRTAHPDWSQRQLECCLYWQGTARRRLKNAVRDFLREELAFSSHPDRIVDIVAYYVPEAHGVNVTATMARLGVALEWPPKVSTYQVAVVLVKRREAKA